MTPRWRTFNWMVLGGTLAAGAAMAAFIVAVDPWKALPASSSIDRPMSNNNQRLLYPMLVRTKGWDSFIFGSSTAMLIDPEQLGAGLGGRFANVALAGGLPWEQLEYVKLVLSRRAAPRTLTFAMDAGWCEPKLVYERDNPRDHIFPHWIYPELSWRNLARVLNTDALWDAITTVRYRLGRFKPEIRDDGYWVFPSYLTAYDPEAALRRIYGSGPRSPAAPVVPPVQIPDAERQVWQFPWLDLLDKALAPLPHSTRVLFVTMPVHATAQVPPGSAAAARDEACKQRTAGIAARHGTALIDMRFHSPITLTDDNYWDPLHYRLHVARQIEQLLVSALRTGRPDDAGLTRIVDRRKQN